MSAYAKTFRAQSIIVAHGAIESLFAAWDATLTSIAKKPQIRRGIFLFSFNSILCTFSIGIEIAFLIIVRPGLR